MGPSDQEAVRNSSTTSSSNHHEVRWTDDSIRWKGGLRVKTSTVDGNEQEVREVGKTTTMQNESDDDEDYVIDPFKLS